MLSAEHVGNIDVTFNQLIITCLRTRNAFTGIVLSILHLSHRQATGPFSEQLPAPALCASGSSASAH